MAKNITDRPIKVMVPRELHWAIMLEAERTGRSMGEILLDPALPKLMPLLRNLPAREQHQRLSG